MRVFTVFQKKKGYMKQRPKACYDFSRFLETGKLLNKPPSLFSLPLACLHVIFDFFWDEECVEFMHLTR